MSLETNAQTAILWMGKDDEWVLTVGGEYPEVGTVLEREGELIQVLGHALRVTRGFAGTQKREHKSMAGAVPWRIAARPMIASPADGEDTKNEDGA